MGDIESGAGEFLIEESGSSLGAQADDTSVKTLR